jgi:hypothetical protein
MRDSSSELAGLRIQGQTAASPSLHCDNGTRSLQALMHRIAPLVPLKTHQGDVAF